MPGKRTTMRSRTGTKLYAKRDAKGQFEDIQSYKRAHGADIKRTAAAEERAPAAKKVKKTKTKTKAKKKAKKK